MASKKYISVVSNLKDKYSSKVIPSMIDHFGYKNKMEVPSITHISINMGIGDGKDNPKKIRKRN